MKTATVSFANRARSLAVCGAFLSFWFSATPDLKASPTGRYRVTGNEVDTGIAYSFRGIVVVSKRDASFSLRYNDGDSARYGGRFNRDLDPNRRRQTVAFRGKKHGEGVTGRCTFLPGERIKFSYRAPQTTGRGRGRK